MNIDEFYGKIDDILTDIMYGDSSVHDVLVKVYDSKTDTYMDIVEVNFEKGELRIL